MFPKYKTTKTKKKFLWWEKEKEIKTKDGWEKIDIFQKTIGHDRRDGVYKMYKCKMCASQIYIGKEKETIFRYCPTCLKKTEEKDMDYTIVLF